MPRKLRVEYPGAIYHLMNRGDRQEAIFRDDGDLEMFLATLATCCRKTDWEVHAWCLMTNHFHLVVETPRGNLVSGMKWLLGTYTTRFNRRHHVTGHLFAGRYKSLLVDGSGDGYLRSVCDYVHLNPSRAHLLGPDRPLKDYKWSSFPEYLKPPGQRPKWLRVDRWMGEHGIQKDSAAGRRELEARLEALRRAENSEAYGLIRRGWLYGSDEFRQARLLEAADVVHPHHYGEERREASEAKARSIVAAELKKLRWTVEDLQSSRMGDPRKVRIARRLRTETTMTLKWIAAELKMGSWTYLSNLLARDRQSGS